MIHYAKYSDNPDMFEQTQFSKDRFIYNSTFWLFLIVLQNWALLQKKYLLIKINKFKF